MRGYILDTRTAALVAALLTVAACHKPSPRTVVIGYGLPPYRPGSVVPVAVQDIQRAANPQGIAVRIVLDTLNAEDAPDIEVKRAQQFVTRPGMVGVVGHSSSRGSLVAAPVYNDAGIVQITPYATSRLLRTAGPWTFNLAPDDSVEGAFIGRFVARRLGAHVVTVFYVNDEYGRGLRDGVLSELRARGVAVGDLVSTDPRSDFPTLVAASLARARPDAVIAACRQGETGAIARLLHEHGLPRPVVAGDGALVLPELAEDAGPAADSVYAVAFWLPDAPDSLSQAFVSEYRRLVGGVPQWDQAMTYDALMLLATAAMSAGPRPADVRAYLESLGRDRPPYRGVTGSIAFTPGGPSRLKMVRLRDGRPVRVPWP